MVQTADVPLKLFKDLREECIWIRTCYNTFITLFHEKEITDILEDSASVFFQDLNRIMQEYTILQICKITDQPGKGDRGNLTISRMNKELCKSNNMTEKIKSCTAKMNCYRRKIEEARNKLIAHNDLGAISKQTKLGVHQEGDIVEFMDAMQQYCDHVAEAVREGPLDFSSSACRGDVLDLLNVLRKGISATSA